MDMKNKYMLKMLFNSFSEGAKYVIPALRHEGGTDVYGVYT